MAASYWDSHCSRNLVSKEQLECSHAEDRLLGLTREHIQQLNVYFCASIAELAKQLKLRQRVAATAMIYFRRAYLCNNFCRLDPRLVYVACLYLACKAEESLLAAKHLVVHAKNLRPKWTYDVKDLLDMEMVLLEDLDFNLIVFSPYRELARLLSDAGVEQACAQRAWGALNDSYRSDVNLLYPPHIVALGCLCLAAGSCGVDLTAWLQRLNVDLGQVAAVVAELTALYPQNSAGMGADECHRLLDLVGTRWDSSASGSGERRR
ncbi:hypothetical protein HYH03_002363 [Edaphochlamys debaryana]|uniref:Cyclin-like domain-containing protein n=1 Tax=Edaphochlamys debaryana TaxID=47281 RepID=A0A835YCH2_9CHLO|nr:hypothetical protein HYH03_002363 [Edaphochlamys debaryana]|eukprot:KAG2500086.1 hypothetical protein HYH03_002363 [Edaphochlamys debaryana]